MLCHARIAYVLLVLLVLLAGIVSAQGPVYLSILGNDDNNGTTWESAVETFEKAFQVAEVSGASVIEVQTGSYYGPGNADLYINYPFGNLTLNAVTNLVFVDLSFTESRFLKFSNFDLTVNGIWFTNGSASSTKYPGDANGGVFYLSNSTINAIGCTFDNSRADSLGGAIYMVDGTRSSFSSCKFSLNKADGGLNSLGGSVYSTGNPTFSNCSFIENYAEAGGAVYIDQVSNSNAFVDCSFISNNAEISTSAYGGAIAISGATDSALTLTITGTNFTVGSSMAYGGAIYVEGANVSISSSVFSANQATQFGGAIYVDNDAIVSANNTSFTSNMGGAFYVDSGGQLDLYFCTFIADLDADNFTGVVNTGGILGLTSSTPMDSQALYILGLAMLTGVEPSACIYPQLTLDGNAFVVLDCSGRPAFIPELIFGEAGVSMSRIEISETAMLNISVLEWGSGEFTNSQVATIIPLNVETILGTELKNSSRHLEHVNMQITRTASFTPAQIPQIVLISSYLTLAPTASLVLTNSSIVSNSAYSFVGAGISGIYSSGVIEATAFQFNALTFYQQDGKLILSPNVVGSDEILTSYLGVSPVILEDISIIFPIVPQSNTIIATFSGNTSAVLPKSVSAVVGPLQIALNGTLLVHGLSIIYVSEALKNGLTTGQIVGIAIGSCLLVAILVGVVVFIVYRYKKSSEYTTI